MPGKLTYFGLGGRAEAIRAMLDHAGVAYENNAVEDNTEIKASGYSPMGGMPLWDEDGFVVCQSNSVLRMLGIRHGYYTEDAQIAYNIDSLCDFQEDIVGMFVQYIFPVLSGGDPGDEEKYITFWNKQSAVVEKRLKGHGKPFVAGTDRPTIADFKLFAQVGYGFPDSAQACAIPPEVQGKAQAVIDGCPAYKAWIARMKTE